MRDIDTSLLRAFVAAVDTGNFSRAARRLNRTTSALSMQIRRLEGFMNAPLFERGARPPALTPAGESLVVYARRMLEINDAAVETVKATAAAGMVRLGIMEDYAATALGMILRDFNACFPDVRVQVETGLTAEFVDRLGADFDIVVAMCPAGGDEGALIRRGRSIWGAAPGFDPAVYRDLPLALYERGCLFRKWATEALDRQGRHWRIGLVSPSLGAVEAAVRAGWAVSVFKDTALPRGFVELVPDRGLPALPDHDIRLFEPPGRADPACEALSEFLSDQLSAIPATSPGRVVGSASH